MRWPGQIDGYRALALTVMSQAAVDARAVQRGRRRPFAGMPMSAEQDVRDFFTGGLELWVDVLGWDAEEVRLALRRQGVLSDGQS